MIDLKKLPLSARLAILFFVVGACLVLLALWAVAMLALFSVITSL